MKQAPPPSPVSAPTAVELEVMPAGDVPVPEAYIFRPRGGSLPGRIPGLLRGGARWVRIPLLSFAVRHPSAGPILIDTGLHPGDLRGDYGSLLSLVFRKLRPSGKSFEEQLLELEIEPNEVALAVMTHLHVDHTGGMRLLPRAEFVCSREEWAAATSRRAVLGGYVSGHLPPESRMRLLDFGREGEAHGPFARTLDLLGDGSVRLVSTPGHTPGHLSVLLRLAGGRQVLLVGDAAYTRRNIDDEVLPLFTTGDRLYLRSLREIKAYAEQEPGAALVPTHDPTAWRELARR